MSIVQVRIIGGIGNQLHMYAAVRKYAQLHGAMLEAPADWLGRRLFGLNDPVPSRVLPEVNDSQQTLDEGRVDVSIGGYFQTQRWVGLLSRAELKQWFKIDPHLLELCGPRPHPFYTACHMRLGDYLGKPWGYCNISEESYYKALAEFGLPLGALEWVREDRSRHMPGLDANNRFDWLPDWVTLLRANVIVRSNSTFSWWAATLSEAQVYSPVVEDIVGPNTVSFTLGNHPKCGHVSKIGVQIDDLRVQP
jgi:hypothetical protein